MQPINVPENVYISMYRLQFAKSLHVSVKKKLKVEWKE